MMSNTQLFFEQKNSKIEYTNEMEDWFNQRTNKHISLVQSYAQKIESYDSDRFNGLYEITKEHDLSKFGEFEKDPYIVLTWQYKVKEKDGKTFTVDPSIQDRIHKATLHHVRNNKHHPEYYDSQSAINRKNRDNPPNKLVDGTNMPLIYIAEMVADWLAVSEERGTSTKQWADNNINVRWKFTEHQISLIYELINEISS